VSGNTSVDVGGAIMAEAVAIGVNGGSAGAQVHEAVKPHARRSNGWAVLAASSHPTAAKAARARTIAQADAARDRVLAELGGNLNAHWIAERLAGSRFD